MNIYVCKLLRSYTNLLENVVINNSIRLLLKQQCSPILKNLLTTVQRHLANLWLQKSIVQENHSVIFQKHWTPNIRLLSSGCVLLNQNKRPSELSVCCGAVYQRGGYIQKSINSSKSYLQLDSTAFSGCAVPNGKLLPKIINLRSDWNTVSSKIVIAGTSNRTSQ